ncbi:unnamed protein product [Lasius platythorax]|uniref:Uncharacterized protein n=1 Tax=Lasius platythorax TaxID=488582 RepID=A0AAV2N0M1_9HYME
MRHARQARKTNSFLNKERIVEDSEERSRSELSKLIKIPGTSHQYACENKRNVDNDTLTSQALSAMNTFSQLSIDACATQKIQSEKVIDIFDDDSVGSVLDVREFCKNASLSNESHAYMDEKNAADNDALTSQSFNTFSENSTDACTLIESENTMQSNMDDIEGISKILKIISKILKISKILIEDIENIEDIEDNIENIEDIENLLCMLMGTLTQIVCVLQRLVDDVSSISGMFLLNCRDCPLIGSANVVSLIL